jgi:hypothetical protein
MESTEFLQQCDQLLNLRGDPCDFGCSIDSARTTISRCREIFPDDPICLVSHWCWADVEISKSDEEYMTGIGKLPAFIYSQSVIVDEQGRFPPGHQLRSSLLVEFRENSIFRTKNTAYILVGPGVRMSVHIDVFLNLRFY